MNQSPGNHLRIKTMIVPAAPGFYVGPYPVVAWRIAETVNDSDRTDTFKIDATPIVCEDDSVTSES